MSKIIEVKNLKTYYGDKEVLKDVSLDVFKGKNTVILGGSGCGKSTLLKHLIGLLKPAHGKILFEGKDITKIGHDEILSIRKKLGVLFQGAALFNSMTIGENVALPLKEHTKLDDSTIKIMVRMKLDQVGLAGFEDYYPSQLSGGMKKRAGLARAMSMDPEILFFDEPSAGLDPITASGLDELILKLNRVFKVTIVVVTHELPSLNKIADNVVMLDKGKVVFCGQFEEFKKCDNEKVQQFLERRADDVYQSPDDYFKTLTKEN